MMSVEFYFGDLEECMICSSPYTEHNPLTRDHIFPRVSCKDHPLPLKEIEDSEINFARICRWDHDKLDRAKISSYFKGGLLVLVAEVAVYPRINNIDLLEKQCDQWKAFFITFRDQLCSLNGSTPLERKTLYDRSAIVSDKLIRLWERGDFDIEATQRLLAQMHLISQLDLLTRR